MIHTPQEDSNRIWYVAPMFIHIIKILIGCGIWPQFYGLFAP